ncbi:MAG: DUF5011 domain-containing protein [bacterium]|nr:DUF5011 domain-containing protein [bacterium]
MKNTSLVTKAFLLLAFLSMGTGQTLASNYSHDDGSITVCKMIVDNEGTIATSSQGLPSGSFSITISKGETATSSSFLQTVTFDASTFTPSKEIILNENDAECVTISNLDENASYFYSEEIVTGTDWISKKYNDQVNTTVNSLNNFFSYSPELWNTDLSDDESRNTDADGHIVLTEGRPNRTVVILNAYQAQTPPQIPTPFCPFSPATDRTIINFDGGKIRSDQTLADSMKSESVSLSAGTYDINLVAFDAYADRVNVSQPQESWHLNLKNGSTDVLVTGGTPDLADNIIAATSTLLVSDAVLADSVDTAIAVHDVYPDNTSPNSVVPVCVVFDKKSEPSQPKVNITASKIVCDAESDLPNWSGENLTIATSTASDFVANNPNCHLESGWEFQWGYGDKSGQDGVDGLSGAFIGEADGSEGTNTDTGSAFNEWKTFGPTDQNGITSVEITDLMGSSRIWIREVLKDGYIPFTYNYDSNTAPGSDESAEMWCYSDVLNYDNFDFIDNPQLGQTYHCVALNALKTPVQNPVCSDGLDNDGDTRTDSADAACHTDGDPNNPNTYDPNGNTENSKPVITVTGDNPFEMILNGIFADPGATALDEEDGDITADIVPGGTVTTTIVGSYAITYDVTDSGGLSADQKTRTVNVNLPANPGTINVCKVIVDQVNTIATTSSGLPAGLFSIKFASTTDFSADILQTVSWDASTFSPNRNIILNDDDAQCVTINNLSLGNYYYSEELISGAGAWATTTKYNDQDVSSVNNVFDFFVYDNALFTATTTDDAGRNTSADGQIVLSAGNYDRTLVILNKYDTTILPQCSDTQDNDGDQKIDSQDPACHTDGNPDNPETYDPEIDTENSKPVITLLGENPVSFIAGSGYSDAGATANDDEDGDITINIVVGGSVNAGSVGSYTLTYDVSDSDGLAADQVTRTVNVTSGGGGGGGCTSNCGGGGGGSPTPPGNGPITPISTPTTPTFGGSCYYLFDFLKQGENNNPVEVRKLQVFLNGFEGENLEVNGFFDDATFAAVSRFQNKYEGDILTPWGHTAPTGYVYILTKKKVNEIYCQSAFPVTSLEQTEIDSFRAFLASLAGAGVITESEAGGTVPPFGNINPSEVEGGVIVPGEVGLGPSTGSVVGVGASNETATTTNNQGGGFGLQTQIYLANLAAAAFTLPENIPDAFICFFTLLLTLVVVYIVSTLVANGTTRGMTRQQMRIRKITYFIAGTLIAFVGGVILKIYCLIIPLLVVIFALAALLLWHNNKGDKKISVTTTNVGGMKKYEAPKTEVKKEITEVKKEEKKPTPIILPPKTDAKEPLFPNLTGKSDQNNQKKEEEKKQ